MVIDRTTGKGCALSIAAKTVTRNLIADGIIGKTIAKKKIILYIFFQFPFFFFSFFPLPTMGSIFH